MSKFKVGVGRGKLTAAVALERAAHGDTIEFDPGHYDLGVISARQLNFVGNGALGEIEVGASISVHEHCTFRNLVIRACPYKNAIWISPTQGFATITDCDLVGDPAGKYSTLYCEAGTVVCERVRVHSEPEVDEISLHGSATLHMTESHFGRLRIDHSQATLIQSGGAQIRAFEGSQVSAYGPLELLPIPGQRILAAFKRSVVEIPHLRLGDAYSEALLDDSLLNVGVVESPSGTVLTALHDNGGKIRTQSDAVVIQSLADVTAAAQDEAAPEPAEPAAPKVIRWALADARRFSEVVAPQVNAGDTILLDEGEYFLDEYEGGLLVNAHFLGQSSAERTILHGTIGPMESGTCTATHLTIRPAALHHHAVAATAVDGTTVLRNVALGHAAGATVHAVFANQGSISLHDCWVLMDADEEFGRIEIDGDAECDSRNSRLGFVQATEGATVMLDECSFTSIVAFSEAEVITTGLSQVESNSVNREAVYVTGAARMTLGELAFDEELSAYIFDGALKIEALTQSGEGQVTVGHSADSELHIGSGTYSLFLLNDAGEYDFVETVSPHTTANAASVASASGADEALDAAFDIAQPETYEAEAPAAEASATDDGPLAELNALTGLTKVKEQIESFVKRVQFDQRRAELGLNNESGFTLHSMFLGNPGTGKTTVAELLGKALYRAGVVSTDTFIEAGRDELTSSNISGTAEKTREVLERALGGILFIDEAYSLAQEGNTHFAQEAVDTIIAFMEKHRGNLMVIFAGYPDKMFEFLNMNEGLKSRIPHRFDFEDYSGDEVATIGFRSLVRDDYRVNEELYRKVVSSAYSRSSDRSNGRWVRNFNQELLQHTVDRVMELASPAAEEFVTISDADIHALAGGDPGERSTRIDQILAELDALVGLEPVKTWVRTLVNRAIVNQRMLEHDGSTERPNYHVAFTGNPGTGKTTVADIVARLFHALGILSEPTVKVLSPANLMGQYLGHTERNTDLALDEAMGGVFFLDEAHQLYSGESAGRDFGPKIVGAMIPRLENDRSKFVAIFAGYTEPMHTMFAQSDPGLRSRVPTEIEFPDYSADEIAQIVVRMLGQRWSYNESLLAELAATAYAQTPEDGRANARWARNFIEEVVKQHTEYLVQHDVQGEAMKQIPDAVLRSVSAQF